MKGLGLVVKARLFRGRLKCARVDCASLQRSFEAALPPERSRCLSPWIRTNTLPSSFCRLAKGGGRSARRLGGDEEIVVLLLYAKQVLMAVATQQRQVCGLAGKVGRREIWVKEGFSGADPPMWVKR